MSLLEDFLFLDYAILTLSIIIIILSFWKGFINSILSLLTWVGSIFITIYTYIYLSEFLTNFILSIDFFSNYEQFVSIFSILISIPIIFLVSLFILKRIRKLVSNDLDRKIIGLIFDKVFGAIYGLIFSYVVYSSALYFTNNNKLNTLYNLNLYFIDNSIILNKISEYNKNIEEYYFSNN